MSDYYIIIIKEESYKKYREIYKLLNETKAFNNVDSVQGKKILKDCRIPPMYHGNDWSIIQERYNGTGKYELIELKNYAEY